MPPFSTNARYNVGFVDYRTLFGLNEDIVVERDDYNNEMVVRASNGSEIGRVSEESIVDGNPTLQRPRSSEPRLTPQATLETAVAAIPERMPVPTRKLDI